jgi:hypothetical protein
MEYKSSTPQADQLNMIIGQKGGVIPSIVSQALSAMQKAQATHDQAAYDKAFAAAVAANGKCGAAWGEVQAWHNTIKTQPWDGEPITGPTFYFVSEQHMGLLNYLVGAIGGPIPSAVSQALTDMQSAIAAGDGAAYNKAFNAAVEANKKNGTAWAWVQRWHNELMTQPISDGSPPLGPGDYPTGGVWPTPLGPYTTTEWAPVAPNELLFTQAVEDGRISSVEGSGGRQVWGTVGDAVASIPFPLDEGKTASAMGASGLIDIKAGQWFTSYFEPDGGGFPSQMRCSTSKGV